MITRAHSIREARRIFYRFGAPPSAERLRQISNYGLLDRLDFMRPRPVIQRLARELAEENKRLPRAQQRGAGGTEVLALEKHIRRQVKLREKGMRRAPGGGRALPITKNSRRCARAWMRSRNEAI
jgi:hypothetical protein